MNTLESLATGCGMAAVILVVLGGAFLLFGKAFDRPETNGAFAVAGAILLGSGMIAAAIANNKTGGSG
jgi:hypothetical protein